MTKTEKSKELFLQGFNCAQSVFAVFAEKYGISMESALKIGGGFGGGMRNAEVCGAVSGGVMVIGLRYGHCIAVDSEKKSICNEKTKEFTSAFKAKNNSIICRDLLDCDIFEKGGMQYAVDNGLFKTTCVDIICDAVEILEKLGY